MNSQSSGSRLSRHLKTACTLLLAVNGVVATSVPAQTAPNPERVAANNPSSMERLRGRTVEAVRVQGNRTVATPVILNVVRTREGQPFDPATVQEDYQAIFRLRKFANVEAHVEPTATGVIVLFSVTEQRTITEIRYVGNTSIDTLDLQEVVDIRPGEVIDAFRISLARQAIERLYRDKNFPYAHVEVLEDALASRGEVIFNVVEGPNVRIRNVNFIGNRSFTEDKLKDQIRTRHWIWIFRAGTLDLEQVDDDVAALRNFYQSKGFFDVRVGRKIIVSPDQSEVQVDFVIEEGQRYVVDSVTFRGNNTLSEAELKANLRMVEGRPFDAEVLQRDVRSIIRAYSPYGFIYHPQSQDPDYLRIGRGAQDPYGARTIFKREAGKVDLVYEISEGKPFKLGRIVVKGNHRTQDKVVLREMRVAPGQLYNSGELQDASDRLRSSPYFIGAVMTPIGTDPEVRDILVEVEEARTASFNIGAGVNSNGGIGGNITYEQRNFDIASYPERPGDIFSDRAFIGAGQRFRISLEPGTEATNASVLFSEPWLFDLPYSLTTEGYLRNRVREDYDENRLGGRISFGKRFNYVWSALLTLRGEVVEIDDIEDPYIVAPTSPPAGPFRAPEILAYEGSSTITSVGISIRRDTSAGGFFPHRGSTTVVGIEKAGALGGEFDFTRYSVGWDYYITVHEDLLDRRTILSLHADSGYIAGQSPFFERFYAGGLGSIRGFSFRGVSPRSGVGEDAIGGSFLLTGSAELSFPITGDHFRGVVFSDFGTVEEDFFRFGTIRSSIGTGIRLVLPFFGQAPLAVDLAWPITKDSEDERQIISFSFGFMQ